MTACETLEARAIAFGSDSAKVEKRLRGAAKLLLAPYRKVLDNRNARFDAGRRILVSADDRFALIWQTRRKPDQPEGYENQQTSEGVVFLTVIGGFEVNPNWKS